MNREMLRDIGLFMARPAADLVWVIVLTFVSTYGHVVLYEPWHTQLAEVCLAAVGLWALARMYGHASVLSLLLILASVGIVLMGYGGSLRAFGIFLGALWIIILAHIAAGEFVALATALYAAAPGPGQKITDTPVGKIFRTVESAIFWIVVVAVLYGIFAPYVPWQYAAILIVLLLVLAIGNAARETPSTEAFENMYKFLEHLALPLVIGLGVLAGLQFAGVVPNNDDLIKSVQKLLHPPDQCAIDRDASKQDIGQKLADNEAWRSKNALWLSVGSALAKEYFAQYESGQAMLMAKLRTADAKYEGCKTTAAKTSSGILTGTALVWFLGVCGIVIAFGSINKRKGLMEFAGGAAAIAVIVWFVWGTGIQVVVSWIPDWKNSPLKNTALPDLGYLFDPIGHPGWTTGTALVILGAIAGGLKRPQVFWLPTLVIAAGWVVYYLHIAKVV